MSFVRKPSTTYKGSELALLLYPRIRMAGFEPGAADAEIICTPAVLPCRACSALVMVRFSKSSAFTEEIAPVTELFFCTPYPTTTTSSKVLLSSFSIIFIVPATAFFSWVTYPIYEKTIVEPSLADKV